MTRQLLERPLFQQSNSNSSHITLLLEEKKGHDSVGFLAAGSMSVQNYHNFWHPVENAWNGEKTAEG